jgi:hypothetical protein
MTKRILVFALTFFSIGTTSYAQGSARTVSTSSFQAYWGEFRTAVLNDDGVKFTALTQFPFKTRGTMDWDPVLRHNRAWFAKNYARLLADDPGVTAELQRDTQRALIERTEQLSEKHKLGSTGWRIGNFEFKKVRGRWLLVMAYWDPEERN